MSSKQAAAVVDLTTSSDDENNENVKQIARPTKRGAAIMMTKAAECTTASTATTSDQLSAIRSQASKRWKATQQQSSGSASTSSSSFLVASTIASQKKSTPSTTTALSATASSTSRSTTTTIKIATYNIWFENTGHEEARMKGIVDALLKSQEKQNYPQMIGFQELTPYHASLLMPHLKRNNYECILQPSIAQGAGSYGVGMAILGRDSQNVVMNHGFVPFANSQQGRGILWAICTTVNDRQVLFTTTHLESYTGRHSNGAKERQVQVKEMEEFCLKVLRKKPFVDLAVLCGDLNWDDERARSKGENDKLLDVLDDKKWIDTYKTIHPKSPGYTYDPKENAMLGGGNLRRRFDRILVRGRDNGSTTVKETVICGKETVPGGLTYMTKPFYPGQQPQKRKITPSDHFGLVTKIQF